MIFETERLIIRALKTTDSAAFFDMMGNPNVMNPIPQKVMTKAESDSKLYELMTFEKASNKKVWSLIEKKSTNFIGICGLLINNDGENEIAYRLRENYWGNGYGTEIAKGLINYGFNTLDFDLITADVYVKNVKSIKILDKFFSKQSEFFNQNDNCNRNSHSI